MNNIDRVAAEIRQRAEQESVGGVAADEFVAFLLEVVNVEDLHSRRPRNVQKEVDSMVRELARKQAGSRRIAAGDGEC